MNIALRKKGFKCRLVPTDDYQVMMLVCVVKDNKRRDLVFVEPDIIGPQRRVCSSVL